MGVSFRGDWDSVAKTRRRMEKNTPQFSASVSKYAATEYVKNVKNAIRNQSDEGQKWIISSRWMRAKAVLNPENENKAWINSETFVNHLRVAEVQKNVYFGGALAKDRHGDSGDLTMAQVAAYNEYGTIHIKPKRLFGPERVKTLQKILPNLTEKAKRYITQDTYTD
jgi:hypothetical protein